MQIETTRLTLHLLQPEQAREEIAALDEFSRQQVSPDWLRRIAEATDADPWLHGFSLVERLTGTALGTAGFTAPPDDGGVVEIAYQIAPDHQGRGYATEAARALVDFAFASGQVKVVRAHTLPEHNASARILTKCGFRFVGEVDDPQDGWVWRWEKADPTA